jgi:deoxyribodipyrimidine photolyase-related protein
MYLLTLKDIEDQQKTKKNAKTYFHKHFYDWQLKKLEIPYIDKSYDELNREKIPDNVKIPNLTTKNDNDSKYVKEAKTYVDKVFKDNYGEVDNFIFPITHKTAKKWISIFLKKRIYNFGTYQDAILKENDFMFHSLLSSSLNIGLITPQEVVDKTIKYYEKNKKEVKINNFEGFIRQVVGWREYQRMLYQLNYDDLIKSNYFNNNKSLNKKWYTGELDILPIDTTIKRAFKNGYLHHIERLMVMLNFMVLARIKPDHVYRWFMEFACDSYDWVMVGNVYGMGYFNTNTMRKPYISTSNYIRNMSDYKDDGKWNLIWDALFYKFLTDNKSKLKGGAAVYLRNLVHFEKKTSKEKKEIFARIKL